MASRRIKVELLPHGRAAILRANFYVDDGVQAQLDSQASSPHVEMIIFSGADVHLLAGDLNHAIVKRGCRDQDIINLSDRFDYINDTSDGSLDRWCLSPPRGSRTSGPERPRTCRRRAS